MGFGAGAGRMLPAFDLWRRGYETLGQDLALVGGDQAAGPSQYQIPPLGCVAAPPRFKARGGPASMAWGRSNSRRERCERCSVGLEGRRACSLASNHTPSAWASSEVREDPLMRVSLPRLHSPKEEASHLSRRKVAAQSLASSNVRRTISKGYFPGRRRHLR